MQWWRFCWRRWLNTWGLFMDSTLRFVGLLESRVFLWAANMDGFTTGSRKLPIFSAFPGETYYGEAMGFG